MRVIPNQRREGASLQEELEAKRAAPRRCYESGTAAFIEFRPNPRTRQGFAVAQLLHHTLEPDPELPLRDSPTLRERLVFAFSTADVVVFGARLSHVVELLRDHKLTAVWPLAEGYSNLESFQPFVSQIVIRPLDKNGTLESETTRKHLICLIGEACASLQQCPGTSSEQHSPIIPSAFIRHIAPRLPSPRSKPAALCSPSKWDG